MTRYNLSYRNYAIWVEVKKQRPKGKRQQKNRKPNKKYGKLKRCVKSEKGKYGKMLKDLKKAKTEIQKKKIK